jgi:siroheme synthase
LLEGIKTEVIAGISSSISGPTMANMPITARGYSSGFSVVSAHLKGNSVNLDWVDLLGKKNHTVVVLMGISRANEILEESKRVGIDQEKPCAIISNASRKNQKVLSAKLKDLAQMAADSVRPAIIVFGDVVKLNKILGDLS